MSHPSLSWGGLFVCPVPASYLNRDAHSIFPAVIVPSSHDRAVRFPLTACRDLFLFRSMPEPYWPKRKNSYTITDAMKMHEVAKIWCHYCKTQRHYLLKDLRTLFGNIEVDDVIYFQKWRCIKCGRDDTLNIEVCTLSAEDRQKLTIRRIERIEYMRKVTWKDEKE